MRRKVFLGITLLGILVGSTPLFSQTFWAQKDLVFGQAAAGGGYESVISATNRGTFTYYGTLWLLTGQGQAWNPLVNGAPVSGGELAVAISPGATQSFHITVNGGVQTGMAFIYSQDVVNNNFLEGSLTYFIRSGGTVTDSVGVQPSQEFYLSTIAFEDFSTIALALNNGTPNSSQVAHVTLTLYNDSGSFVASTSLTLGSAWHSAQFLTQFFLGINLGRGRLEISSSDYPIFGTALTLVNNQFSSLPLVGSPRSYTFTTTSSNGSYTSGDASLWADGFYVKGYIRFTNVNGFSITPEVYYIAGRLIGTTLRVSFFGDSGNTAFGGTAANVYARISNFNFSAQSMSDIFVVTWVDPGGTYPFGYGTTATGQVNLTRSN